MRRDSYVEHLGFLSCVHKADNTHRTYYDHLTEHSLRDGALGQTKLRPNGVLRSSLGGGHCTLGWAPTPTTWAASARLRTLKAIHAPLIASTTAPAGTVGGVAWAPIVSAYTRPKMYINTGAKAQSAPAHLGRIPERQTATPSTTLPTNPSRMDTPKVAVCRVLARVAGSSPTSSMPARTICPSKGAEKVETPPTVRKRALPKMVMTMATNPMRPARLLTR